jgi:hypothetical protein
VNPYKDQIEMVAAGWKPEVAKKVNDLGRQTFSFAIALTAAWTAGDDQAGKILDEWGLKAIGKTSAMAEIFNINVSDGKFETPKEWWKNNLAALADGLLVRKLADKVKESGTVTSLLWRGDGNQEGPPA